MADSVGSKVTYFLVGLGLGALVGVLFADRKSTRLNSSHSQISYAVFCLKKKKKKNIYNITDIKPQKQQIISLTRASISFSWMDTPAHLNRPIVVSATCATSCLRIVQYH